MSNKIGINLRNCYFLLGLWLFATFLHCFEPGIADFSNTYQYELYRSWLQNDRFDTDFPAGFTSEKAVKSFQTERGKKIEVEYDWQNYKIYNQREILPFIFLLPEKIKLDNYIHYLESMVYRLNAYDRKFLEDYVDLQKINLNYGVYEGKEALDMLGKAFVGERAKIFPIELKFHEKYLQFRIPTQKKEITVEFETDMDLPELMQVIRDLEKAKSPAKPIIEPRPKKVPSVEKIDKYSLAEYISEFYHDPPARELLHNKVKNIAEFLEREFPDYSRRRVANKFILHGPDIDNRLFSDIRLEVIKQRDGVDFQPSIDHEIIADEMILNGKEKISLTAIDENELEKFVPYIPQLVYAHRALGSKLLNFFLIHDVVPTTLVLRAKKREVYEISSYADLLLLLNHYWQERQVFFSLTSIKKINGAIEMQGFLVAQNDEKKDIAEILFHINRDYKLDLIMMKLHTKE